MTEPNRGTLGHGKAARGIHKYQNSDQNKPNIKIEFDIFGWFYSIKACSVSIAVSGVFLNAIESSFGSKEFRTGPRRPKYMWK